ncbi:PREDICTED: uncharacterized protein LOC106744093 [Dinoponera quadriceps]|uniref:Uncharacterized protein LOC106744093 n=1 Tax=Dinoponera quadriceps TaxID=609295 RepID=A0A6P3X6T4_DINQU|nr:PREDICTED: uncharacterized protein LOC106744093 [Dinoponera quadriceps]
MATIYYCNNYNNSIVQPTTWCEKDEYDTTSESMSKNSDEKSSPQECLKMQSYPEIHLPAPLFFPEEDEFDIPIIFESDPESETEWRTSGPIPGEKRPYDYYVIKKFLEQRMPKNEVNTLFKNFDNLYDRNSLLCCMLANDILDKIIEHLPPDTKETVPLEPEKSSDNNIQDVKCETSTNDFQNVKDKTLKPDLESLKEDENLRNNSQNVEYKEPNILTSLYSPPNKYLIVEDVQKNVGQNFCSDFPSIVHFHELSSNPDSEIFAIYQKEEPEKPIEKEEQDKTELPYYFKLAVKRADVIYGDPSYWLDQSVQCMMCSRNLQARLTILDDNKSVLIDDVMHDFMIPYKYNYYVGLAHYNCKKDFNRSGFSYHCTLLHDRKLKEPITTMDLFYTLIIMLALTNLPIFLGFLVYDIFVNQINRIDQREMWIILLYMLLFVLLAISQLYSYYKKRNNIIEKIYLVVWENQPFFKNSK